MYYRRLFSAMDALDSLKETMGENWDGNAIAEQKEIIANELSTLEHVDKTELMWKRCVHWIHQLGTRTGGNRGGITYHRPGRRGPRYGVYDSVSSANNIVTALRGALQAYCTEDHYTIAKRELEPVNSWIIRDRERGQGISYWLSTPTGKILLTRE